MCSAPVLAVLDYNVWGRDQFGPQTNYTTPMPLDVWVLFFGGFTLVIAAIIFTALANARGKGSRWEGAGPNGHTRDHDNR